MLTLDDVIYMIVTDRFARGDPAGGANFDRADPMRRHGGDLMGIVSRMPYLKDLGVTALWITPVYLNPPDSYHGYHPLDFERVDPHLCSPSLGESDSRETVRRFVEIAHQHGLKVMLDMVVSHTGETHPWVQQRPDWINWNGHTVEKEWFKNLPNINHDNVDVNVYFVLNVLNWIAETGADAVRIDAARHVETQFWRFLKLYSQGLFPETTVVGEFWDGNPDCVAPFQNLHGFHSMFDFPLYHAIRDVFIDDHPFGRIVRPHLSDHEPLGILDFDEHYRNAYQLITFIGNHDAPRFFEAARGIQDPDEAVRRMKMALLFLMTTRGIPQLYYGDELALAGGYDPDNRRDMPWDWINPQENSEQARRARDMLAFTRDLIALRRSSNALCWGLHAVLYLTPTLQVSMRFGLDEVVVVALNNGAANVDVCVPLQANPAIPSLIREVLIDGLELECVLGASPPLCIREGGFALKLPGRTTGVYRVRMPAPVGAGRRALESRVSAARFRSH